MGGGVASAPILVAAADADLTINTFYMREANYLIMGGIDIQCNGYSYKVYRVENMWNSRISVTENETVRQIAYGKLNDEIFTRTHDVGPVSFGSWLKIASSSENFIDLGQAFGYGGTFKECIPQEMSFRTLTTVISNHMKWFTENRTGLIHYVQMGITGTYWLLDATSTWPKLIVMFPISVSMPDMGGGSAGRLQLHKITDNISLF